MINKRFIQSLLVVVTFCMLIIPARIHAASSGLSVQPITSDAQRNKAEPYFDVVVKPGQSTDLKVQLVNNTNKDIKVKAVVRAGQTNDNGAVDYTGSQKKDKTLKYDLSKYLKGPKTVIVPANGKTIYDAKLTMPAKQLAGLMAGGLTFSPVNYATTTKQNAKLSIKNKFSYEIAVITRNVNQTWQPKLVIGRAKVTQSKYKNTLAVPMHNTSATFLNQLKVHVKATNTRTHKTYTRTASAMQMAPNSHFYYQVKLPTKVATGKYHVKTTAYYVKDAAGKYTDSKGTTYRYKKAQTSNVTVTAKRSRHLQHKIKQAQGGTPWFVYAIIGLVVGLLIVIGVLVRLLLKKRSIK